MVMFFCVSEYMYVWIRNWILLSIRYHSTFCVPFTRSEHIVTLGIRVQATLELFSGGLCVVFLF